MWVSLLLGACEAPSWKPARKETEQRRALARVYDQMLYADELDNVVPKGSSSFDSSRLMDSYVRNWVVKQLMIKEAGAYLNVDMQDIERRVQDYRYALIAYEFEKQYVNERLNREVTLEEIQEYYEQNQANFELKQNIIRGRFLKVPKAAPRQGQLPDLMKSNAPAKLDELRSYSLRFAEAYHLEDSTWVNFDEMIRYSPLAGIPNKVQFLRSNTFAQIADDTHQYYLRIHEYRITNQISPIEFVEDNIRSIIVNMRKVELANTLEREIYEKAKNRGDFEVIKP